MGSLFVEHARTPAEASPHNFDCDWKVKQSQRYGGNLPGGQPQANRCFPLAYPFSSQSSSMSNLNPLYLVDNSACPVLGMPAVMLTVCPTAS